MERYPDLTNGFPVVETKRQRAYDYRSGAYHNKPKAVGELSPISKGLPMKAFLLAYYRVSLGVANQTHFYRSSIDSRLILQRALECENEGQNPKDVMGVWYHADAGTWAMIPKSFGVWLKGKGNRKRVTGDFDLGGYNELVTRLKAK